MSEMDRDCLISTEQMCSFFFSSRFIMQFSLCHSLKWLIFIVPQNVGLARKKCSKLHCSTRKKKQELNQKINMKHNCSMQFCWFKVSSRTFERRRCVQTSLHSQITTNKARISLYTILLTILSLFSLPLSTFRLFFGSLTQREQTISYFVIVCHIYCMRPRVRLDT